MKKLLLCFFCVRDELNVIHYQNVVLPVLVFEAIRASGAHSIYVINRESLGCNVEYLFIGVRFFEIVAHRLYEVSFSVPRRAIDKKRVVYLPRSFNNRFCGRVRELVEWANNESLKRITRVEIIALIYV